MVAPSGSVYVRVVPWQPKPPVPRPIQETWPALAASLDALLRAAVDLGGTIEGTPARKRAVARASRARAAFNQALDEVQSSERKHGREGAANWIASQLAAHGSSAAVGAAGDVLALVESAIKGLREATW